MNTAVALPATQAPCVLLRGLARGSGHWGKGQGGFADQLAHSLAPGALLLPDLPGNGMLWNDTSPTRVGAMTDALRQQLAPTLEQGPVRLVAMSLGAMVALDWVHRFPNEVQSAALINTSLRGLSPPWMRLRPAAARAVLGAWLQAVVGLGDVEQREATVLRLTSQLAARNPTLAAGAVAHWVSLQTQYPVQPANLMRQLWAAARFKAPQTSPAMPVLVLNGAGDALVHPACSAAVAQAWGAPMCQHPTAGHDLPLDDPEWVAAQLSRWWCGLAPAPAQPDTPAATA